MSMEDVNSEVSRINDNISATYATAEAQGATMPDEQTSDNLAATVESIGGAGVKTFNGRSGEVVPQSGDYTADMVGAAATDHNHDDKYYTKEETDSMIEEAKGSGGSKIYLAAPTGVTITNADESAIIKWTDPNDTAVESVTLAKWSGTVVVRKVGSAPTSKTDGTIVVDSRTRNAYATAGYTDTGLTNGTTYYYGIFPYSEDDVVTTDSVTTFTPSAIYPTAASGITVTNKDEAVSVAYTKPSDATAVKIVYKSGSAPTSPTDGTAVNASSSPVSITGLTNGTTYYFVVYTYNAKRYTAAAAKSLAPSAIYPSAATGVSIENGILAATVSYTKPSDATSVKIVYKAGSTPTSPTDGTAVTSSSSPTTISGLVNGTTYYFVVYTYNAKRYKASSAVSVTAREAEVYAFTVNQSESNPASMITYPSGCDNANYTPAAMGSSAFSYGSWANAFFIKKLKVVMLNFDGTEAYEINQNDYTKKVSGAAVGTEGNVMVAFPKIYFKIVEDSSTKYTVYVSDVKLDDDYHCWSHIGRDGTEQDYCYVHAYEGSNISSKLRSLTGQTLSVNTTAATEITYATANGTGWYTDVVADYQMITMLLMLIGKNMNSQATFGNGNCNTSAALKSGTMDTKGLFWGDISGQASGVKVFGIENFWGNIWKRVAGYVDVKGVQKVKLTYGTQDGSTTTGWNTTGDGYITLGTTAVTTGTGGYLKEMKATQYGLYPQPVSGGSATTYYCDYYYIQYNSSTLYYALFGGYWSNTTNCGFVCWNLNIAVSYSNTVYGAALSFKK